MKKLLYPFAAMLVFIPLMLALFLGGEGDFFADAAVPLSLGLLAYSLMLIEIFLSTRPQIFESRLGLQSLYAAHGVIATIVLLSAIIHIGMELAGTSTGNIAIPTAPLGILGLLLLIISVFMGVWCLSSVPANRASALNRKQKTALKRESALKIHQFSLFAVLLLFGHAASIPEIRANRAFFLLLAVYTAAILIGYGWAKVKSHQVTHKLEKIERIARNVYQIDFRSISSKPLKYHAGQYVFVRFTQSLLPKESHPFSIVSFPSAGKDLLTIMVKQSGDFTQKIDQLRRGDKASIEGPYGNYWDSNVSKKQTPIVLLAGGIGITPHLSILQELIVDKSERPIYLIWGAATLQDAFNLGIFQKWEQEHPNFKFYLVLSRENRPPYFHGQISNDFLSEIGLKPLYPTADFFICGPAGMMTSMKSVLLDNGVEDSRIHVEKFSF